MYVGRGGSKNWKESIRFHYKTKQKSEAKRKAVNLPLNKKISRKTNYIDHMRSAAPSSGNLIVSAVFKHYKQTN